MVFLPDIFCFCRQLRQQTSRVNGAHQKSTLAFKKNKNEKNGCCTRPKQKFNFFRRQNARSKQKMRHRRKSVARRRPLQQNRRLLKQRFSCKAPRNGTPRFGGRLKESHLQNDDEASQTASFIRQKQKIKTKQQIFTRRKKKHFKGALQVLSAATGAGLSSTCA